MIPFKLGVRDRWWDIPVHVEWEGFLFSSTSRTSLWPETLSVILGLRSEIICWLEDDESTSWNSKVPIYNPGLIRFDESSQTADKCKTARLHHHQSILRNKSRVHYFSPASRDRFLKNKNMCSREELDHVLFLAVHLPGPGLVDSVVYSFAINIMFSSAQSMLKFMSCALTIFLLLDLEKTHDAAKQFRW